jgi:hypothetical protein
MKMLRYSSIQCSPISELALLFGRFPGLARLSLYEQHVDEDEYEPLVG